VWLIVDDAGLRKANGLFPRLRTDIASPVQALPYPRRLGAGCFPAIGRVDFSQFDRTTASAQGQ
jgi:hypothetical protein